MSRIVPFYLHGQAQQDLAAGEYDLTRLLSTVDIRGEQGQARYLRDFLTAVFSHPAADAIVPRPSTFGRMDGEN